MNQVLKISLFLYIASVLLFSSWSRAFTIDFAERESDHPHFTDPNFNEPVTHQKIEKLKIVSKSGFVFEDQGYLFFQPYGGKIYFVHHNSFELFENVKLPVKVKVFGASIDFKNDQFDVGHILQINKLKFLEI